MNDLISRQAAIDAFWKLDIELRPSAIDAITDMLKTLPSAQPVAKDINVPSTDLISRQAAIDAICKACYGEGDYHKCDGYPETNTWCDELVALRALPSAQPEIIRCKDCIYYDPPHIENNGERYEYKDMPKEAFDIFGIGVSCEYGINVGGRCERDYNAGYDDDKRVFVPESNFCGRARRRTNGSD